MRGALVVSALCAGCGFSIEPDNQTSDAPLADGPGADGVIDAPDASACPPFYRTIGTGLYAVLTPTTFKNHVIACRSHGTHLAVIDNAQELAELVAYGRAVAGVMQSSRFYVGLVQTPDQANPEDGWVDLFDRDVDEDLWAQSGQNEPNDGPDDNETNHQEQVGAIQLDREALVDLAITENVRAYCECDGMTIGVKAQSVLDALP